LLAGAVGLLVIDWGQTHDLARRNQVYYQTPACQDPETRSLAILYNGSCPTESRQPYHELNPLLPKNPSSGDVDKYFALAIIGTHPCRRSRAPHALALRDVTPVCPVTRNVSVKAPLVLL
jgi:hypothetical protein